VNSEAAIKASASLQATILAEGSTVISGVKNHKIKVVAGYRDVTNGKVTMVI